MSTTPPILQRRDARAYLAIPLTATADDLPRRLPDAFRDLLARVRAQGGRILGAPFVRYRAIAPEAEGGVCDVDVGVPVDTGDADRIAAEQGADGRLRNGALPPGTYATLVHTGPLAGLRDAARALLEWGEANGVAWHRRDESRAERWEARVEAWLGDPAAEPDPAHWRTEISFLTKED